VHVFVGMRGSGKSTGMKAVLYELRKYFDNGILMSAAEEVRCHGKSPCRTYYTRCHKNDIACVSICCTVHEIPAL